MQEVFGIGVALAALIVGLLGISWAYGDFERRSDKPAAPSPNKQ